MKVTTEWIDLTIKEYEDGKLEAYESIGDESREGDWATIKNWVMRLLDRVEQEAIEEEHV